MRRGLRNAVVRLAPGGDVARRRASCPEIAGITNSAPLSVAGRIAADFAMAGVVAASANSTSQSCVETDDSADAAMPTAADWTFS
jgi:hypothetical protein